MISQNHMQLEQKLEAILFWKGEPISIKKLEDMLSTHSGLKVSTEELNEAILKLKGIEYNFCNIYDFTNNG